MLKNIFSGTCGRQTKFELPAFGSSHVYRLSSLVYHARDFLSRRFKIDNLSTSEGLLLLHSVEHVAQQQEKSHKAHKKKKEIVRDRINVSQEGAYFFLKHAYGLTNVDLFVDADPNPDKSVDLRRKRAVDLNIMRDLAHLNTLDPSFIRRRSRLRCKNPSP